MINGRKGLKYREAGGMGEIHIIVKNDNTIYDIVTLSDNYSREIVPTINFL